MSPVHTGSLVRLLWCACLALMLAACGDSAQTVRDGGADGRVDDAGRDGATDGASDGDGAAPDGNALLPCPKVFDEGAVNPSGGTGKALWLKSLVVGGSSSYYGAAGAPNGQFYLQGVVAPDGNGATTFAGRAITGIGGQGFIAQLDASGALKQFVSSSWINRTVMVADADGVYVVFGWADSDVTVGTTTASVSSNKSLVIARVDSAGTVAWVKAFGSSSSAARKQYVALDGASRLHIAALFDDKLSVGGKDLDCDVVQLVVDKTGTLAHSRCITKKRGSLLTLEGFVVDSAGDATVSGFPGKSYDVGFGVETIESSGGGSVVVRVAYDGTPVWRRRSVGAYLRVRAVLSGGRIAVVGHVPQWGKREFTITGDRFGASCSGSYDHHVSVLDSSGKRVSTTMHGGTIDNVFVGPSDALMLVLQPTSPFLPGNAVTTSYSVARIDGSALSWLQDLQPSSKSGADFIPGARAADGTGRLFFAGQVKGVMSISKGDSIDHGSEFGDYVMLFEP